MRPWTQTLLTVGFYAVVCVVWCWPLASSPQHMLASSQFDYLGTIWLANVSPMMGQEFVSTLAEWPVGREVWRLDSLVLLAVTSVLGRWIQPFLLIALFTLLGPVLSAWAAERFAAKVLGARWPWSLVAGLTYGFSGIAASAFLEGHVYMLLNPWLPLMAWQWHRTCSPEGRLKHGALTGLLWALCLLTSAYAGIAASIWLLAGGIAAVLRRDVRWRPILLSAAVVLLAGLGYVLLFSQGGELLKARDAFFEISSGGGMRTGSANLATLAGVTSSADSRGHSIVPALGFLPLVLVIMSTRLRPRRGPWRLCIVLGVVSLAISLGPYLRASADGGGLPWILRPLLNTEAAGFFRFPSRMFWIAALAWGAVAAAVLDTLARQSRWAAALFLLALLDLLVVVQMPARTARIPLGVPSAYSQAPQQGALLPLLPALNGAAKLHETFLHNLECTYQSAHNRPLMTTCVGGAVHRAGTRWRTATWLRSTLMEGHDLQTVGPRLASFGVGGVVLRPDLFFPSDWRRLRGSLQEALGAPVAQSKDAGDYVLIYAVPNPAGRDDALKAWRSWAAGKQAAAKPSAASPPTLKKAASAPGLAKRSRHELVLQLAVPTAAGRIRAWAEVSAGASPWKRVRLADDGRHPWDQPGDGVYVGRTQGIGSVGGAINLRLFTSSLTRAVFSGAVQRSGDRQTSVAWRLEPAGERWRARLTAAAFPGRGFATSRSLSWVAMAGWGLFLALSALALALLPSGSHR